VVPKASAAVVSATLYRRNLEEIIDNILATGTERILLPSPPPRCEPDAMEMLRAYRDVGRALCEARSEVLCGPDLLDLLDARTDLTSCNVHPNESGTSKMARALERALGDMTHKEKQ